MFAPTVAKQDETAFAATVTTTAGDATLAVADMGTIAPGHLVNGTFALPSPSASGRPTRPTPQRVRAAARGH